MPREIRITLRNRIMIIQTDVMNIHFACFPLLPVLYGNQHFSHIGEISVINAYITFEARLLFKVSSRQQSNVQQKLMFPTTL